MSQQFNQNENQEQSPLQEHYDMEYRMVMKKFYCHVCNREFRKMRNSLGVDEVECPECHQTFCEEISANNNLQQNRQELIQGPQQQPRNQQQSQVSLTAAQSQEHDPNANSQQSSRESGHGFLSFLRNLFREDSPARPREQPVQEVQPRAQVPQAHPVRRIIRRTITDNLGNQTVIEEVYSNAGVQRTTVQMSPINIRLVPEDEPSSQQSVQPEQDQQRPPESQPSQPHVIIFQTIPTYHISQMPVGIIGFDDLLFRNNFDQNFRSVFGDNLIEQIIRLSEQDRGRLGTPPASKTSIDNLEEVQISDQYCKIDEKSGQKELPRCTICCEDLKDKATLMPCGHLFNKECITEWLSHHNQCPICRFELPTDDPDYERLRLQRQQQNQSEQSN